MLAAAGIVLDGRPRWFRVRRALLWSGLLLMVWAANGLPFDLLRMTRLIPLGIDWPGLVRRTLAIPRLLAAALSLLLVSTRSWIPRRLLLAAGWFATGVVAMIGPAACWVLIPVLVRGGDPKGGIAIWVFAATRSYQLRGADLRMSSPT